ncbi:MAG: radical SAM protein [Myxococcales bacterium]|nr:radical SAM protein [Myxococcales bacterium]
MAAGAAGLRESDATGRNALPIALIELYASIQGESTHAGRPCTFVRLAGCPLRCRWCDSAYTFVGGTKSSIGAIVAEVRALGLPLVEVTGGEPLAQKHAPALVAALADAGFEVLIETSGAFPLAHLDPRARVIADLKCPASQEAHRNLWDALAGLRAVDELKIVVADRADFDWALAQLPTRLAGLAATILWSAVHGEVAPADLASWLLETRAPGRLQLQLHKLLWPAATRGV